MSGKRAPLVIIIFIYLSMLLSATQYAHADTNLVPPPTNLTATAVSSSEIHLSWTAPTAIGLVVSGYEIERSTNGGLTWAVLVTDTGSTATTYEDTGLTHTTLYTYRVHTIAPALGTSFPSNTASATTLAVAPSPPTGLAATAASSSQINLSWTAPADDGGSPITGYKIERSADGGTTWITLTNTCGTSTSCSDTGLPHATTFAYRVSAINSIGTGSPSNTPSATTLAVAPSSPSGLTATAVSPSQISLSWTAPADNGGSPITGYRIEKSIDGGSAWTTLVGNTGNTATTYSDTGLAHTTTYTYRVSAINSIGTGSSSTNISATTLIATPSPPTGLVATTVSSSQINLSWTAPSDNGGSAITGYKIERSTDGGSTWSSLANTCGTSTSCSDTGLTRATKYTYRVSAINSAGTGSSSSVGSATTLAVAPSPPTGLAATAASPSQISLSWTAPSDNGGSSITGYKIERSTDGGTTWTTLVVNTGSASTTFSDTSLTHTTTYTYRVSAINSIGTGSPSSTVSATTPIATPSPPTGLAASASSSSQISLSWTAPADNGGSAITGYKIDRSTDGGLTWSTIVSNSGSTATTYSDTVLTRATTYTYRVSAINSAGTGFPSDTKTATTLAVAPSPPSGLTATAVSSSQIGLTWTAPTDNGGSAITGYKIERSTDGGTTWTTVVANTGSTATTYSDTGLAHTTTYTYRVSGINSAGTGSPSTANSAKTLDVAPSPPTGLTASVVSSSQINLSWTAPADSGGQPITGYKIERSTDGGTTWTSVVASTGSASTAYSDTGLAHSTTYTYRVSAINAIGTSSPSNTISATTPIATPAPPTGLSPTAASSSQINLSWTAPTDNGGAVITGYKIERSADGGTTWTILFANTGGTSTTFSDTGLAHSTTYTYRVSAINSAGTGSPSVTNSAKTLDVAPSPPTGLTATVVSSSQINLVWTAPADSGGQPITGYKIERSTDSGATWTTVVASTGSAAVTYSDTGLAHTTTYTYRVSAINSVGTSSPSNTISATTPVATPSPPTGLTAAAVSSSQINLSWTAPSDNGGATVSGYKIERSTDGGTTWTTLVANTASASTAYSDTGLTHTTTYTYRISAINSAGTGSPSATAPGTTLNVAPSPPTGLTATAVSSSSVSLTWIAPSDSGGSPITGYKIERSTDGGSTWTTVVASTGSAAASYSDTGLTHTTTYTYRVSAINAIGTSSPSNTISATTPIATPAPPTAVTATPVSSTQINLSWTAPADNGGSPITGYKIERSADGGSTWTTIVSNSASTSTAYSDSGLTHTTTYTYRVSAINSAGTGSPSASAPGTTLDVAPSPPTGLTATAVLSTQINLSWTAPADNGGTAVTGYKIERSTDGGTTWTILVTTTASASTAYSDTGLAHTTTYTYRVSAVNTIGTGSPSNTISATTPAATPSPPSGLTATAASSSSMSLTWTAPTDNGGAPITGYKIERSSNSGTTWTTVVANTASASTTYSDTALAHTTTYTYRVSAINSAGTGSPSSSVSATTLASAASPPTGLVATAGPSQISLTWTAPADNGGSAITGYKIERSTDSGSTWITLVANTGSATTTYSDVGLSPNVSYTYRVSAINSVGTSSPSNTSSAMILAVAPSPPTGLTATTVPSTQINLSWTASNNGGSPITGYKIERSTDGGTTWTILVANTGSTATTYSDTGLAHTTTYYYRVSAINSVGTSSPSATANATTPAITASPLTGLTATASSSSQINLSWSPPADNGGASITGYKIERSTDGGITWTALVANTGSTATTYSDTGLIHSTSYAYRVSSINSVGTSSPSNVASTTTLNAAPSAPTGLTAAAASSSQINLSWTAPTDNGGAPITGYTIERSTSGGSTWTTLVANTGGTGTTYSDTALTASTTYTYRVSAINSVGTGSPSNTVPATTLAAAPSSPTGLTATASSSSQIVLGWASPTNNGGSPITGYKIERSTDGGTTWTTLATNTGSPATTYSDAGLAHTTTYYYRVSAINSVGTSSPSNVNSATTLAAAPSAPTGLTATGMSSSQINLSWTASSDNGGSAITGYKIERSTDGGTTWTTVIANTGVTSTTFSDTGLSHSTTYYYRVSAVNPVGTSSPSNTSPGTTLNVAPSPPTGLTATAASSSQINLSWSLPTDNGGSPITGYKIERSVDGGATWSTLVANSGSPATTYSDTGLAHATTYYYRVSAINSIGQSSPSNVASGTTTVVPSPPTGLTAATSSSSQINLSWSPPADNGGAAITGYRIERSATSGSTWSTLVLNSGSTSTTYSDTALTPGTTYAYKVSAINSIGTGTASTTASATTLAVAPSPPTGLTAAAVSSTQINLSWTTPYNGGSPITGYKIERSIDGGSTWSVLVANTGGTGTTYLDTGLSTGTSYAYRVSAINSVGTSTPSNVASSTTTVSPSPPTGLAAAAVSSSQINLSWTAPADNGGSPITGYKIERSTDGGTTWTTVIANTGVTSTTFSDTGLSPGTLYFYRVSAINSVGTGLPSNTASATTPAVAPSPPTGLTATAVASSQINLGWTAPNNGGSSITGYMIERSNDGGTTWTTLVANSGVTSTTYSDTGLAQLTTYTYRVSAINAIGRSSPSSTASATTSVPPSPPTGLTATAASSSQINLSWTAPADNGGTPISGYKIERSTDGGTTWTTVVANTGITATTYSDTGLTHTTTYTYRVSATNSVGTSSPSNVNSATTLGTAPSPPTGLGYTTASSSSINLTWSAPSDNGGSTISGYMIERSTNGGSTWAKVVSNTGSTSTSYSDTGLASGTTYVYRVSAINAIGTSSPSNTVSATTLAVAPSPPTGLTATAASSSQINLSWTAPTNNGGSPITGYKIERSSDSGSTWTIMVNTGSASTTYSDTGLAHTTTYTYRVSAINAIGTSSPSNVIPATTLAAAPSPPTGLTATTMSSSQINLSWTAPADNGGSATTGYKIERSTDGGSTWSTLVMNTGGTGTTYSDTGLAHTTTYTYRVSAINSVGTSSPSNTYSTATSAVAPSPPTGLTATAISSSQINLSWTAPADNGGSAITGYKVEKSTDGGTTWSTLVANTASFSTTYSDVALAHTTTYTYRVSAINSVGTSSPSNANSATTLAAAPSAPMGLTATGVSSSQVSLSWTAPADSGGSTITGYKIERSMDGGTTWATLVANTGITWTTYSDTGLSHTTTYTYRVSAINSVGTSSPSNANSATTLAAPPTAPTGLATTVASPSQINLSWTAPADNGGSPITGYKIERSTDGGTTWTSAVANTASASTTYLDTGLSPGTTYTYRVSAINSAGTSSPSATALGTTPAITPSAPTGLTATAPSSSQINLGWTAPNNGGSAITGYKIERSTDGGSTWSTLVANTGSTATTYSDTGLTHTTTYYYRVSAINSVGTGSPSTAVPGTTLNVPPSAPTGLTAMAASPSQINLSWTAPADSGGAVITGYMIERSTDGGSTWSTLVANTGSASTAYSDTGLAHTTTYTYRVSAINSVGTGSPSNTISATTPAITASPLSGLTATTVSSSQINLSWSPPTDNGGSPITGYKVERSTDGGNTWSPLVANTASTATTYSDTGLTHTTQYTYRVSAINFVGTSSPSNTASATTLNAAPSTPTGLSAVAASSSQINLSWTTPGDNGGSTITGYKIERSSDSGSTWSTLVANTGSTATAYSDTGLSPGTTYTYRVSAINSVGTGSPSATVPGTTPAIAPSAPTGLTAITMSSSQINLGWTAPNNGGSAITGYKIERSADSGSTWTTLVANTGSTSTTYSDTGLTHTTTYTYRVSAINSVGTGSPSAAVPGTTPATTPSTPTGLTATATSSSQINLSWSPPADNGGTPITGYKIERSTDGGSTWSTLTSNTGSASTAYSDTGLTHTSTYYYRVSAINSVGTSSPSNMNSAMTLAAAPSAPSGLTATPVSSSQINLSWTAPSDNGGTAITGYKVERSNDGGTTWGTLVANTGSTSTTYSDTGLSHTTTYTYRVSAINSVGIGSASGTQSAGTFAVAPSTPTGLTATTVSSSQINLSWTAPSDNGGSSITGYKIERSTDGGSTWSTLVANTGVVTTTYSDAALAHSTAYTYRVSAINSVGTGSPSNIISATTLDVPPTSPTGLLAASSSSSQINLSWTAPSDNGGRAITGYKIERSTDGGTTWSILVANTGSASTAYSDTGLAHTTTYNYRVSAINSVGTGSPSNAAPATTLAASPSPPTGLTAAAISSSQINLSWTAPSDNGGTSITGYKIERSTDGGSTWSTLVASTGSASTAYSDTSLAHNTQYTYRVSAINSVGTGSPSGTVAATTLAVAPSPPTGLTATAASSSQINLSWAAPADNGGSAVSGYKIERSTDSSLTWSTIVANTGGSTTSVSNPGSISTTYSDTGLSPGTTYYYRVSAINSAGTGSPSTTAPATTPAVAPSSPTGLTATAASPSQINLVWTTPANNGGSPITGYKIERSTDGGSTWTIVSNSASTATTYSDTGLSPGTTYTYRVSAINSVGTGSPSNTAPATTPAIAPSPPTGLAATTMSSSQINLSWTAPNNGGSAITGYMIERSSDGGSTWSTLVGNTGSTGTTYSDKGLVHSTTYTYRVSAINSVGTGSPSGTAAGKTLDAAPSPPTGLTATAVSSSQISLSWTTPSDNGGSPITGYMIERSVDAGSTWTTIVSNSGSTSTTYSDTGLTHTTTYTYRVSATNAIGTSAPSNTYSGTTLAASPSAPTGVTATTVSSSQINLSWTAPSDNGGSPLTGYKIDRSTDGGSTWTTVVSNSASTSTTYSDTGLTHSTTYTYKVSAINSAGTGSPSTVNSATTLDVAPSPPTGLTAAASSSSQINLSWTAPSDTGGRVISGYKVERSIDSGSTWSTLVANTGSASTTYSDTGLAPGTTYYYRVSAINSVGTSTPSNTAFTTTPALPPSPPTGVKATAISASQINLSWTAPSNNGGSPIKGYMIERSTDSGTTWSTLTANTGSTASTYSDTGLIHATTYTYRVSAINSAGTGSPSLPDTATTLPVPPAAPTGFTATTVSSSQINLSWTAPSDTGGAAISGYKIERSIDGGTTWTTIVPNSNTIATTYSDTGLAPGTTYTYRVSAINTAGTSPPSSSSFAKTLAVAPSAPTGLTATAVSSSTINLSWTAPNNGGSAIIGYMIERSADGGTTWSTLVANTGSTSTAYANTGLPPSTSYAYRVSAINSVGTSPPSNIASATTNTGTVSLVTPGLVASDQLNKTLTQQQLTANPGFWTFDGSAKAGGYPYFFNEDAQGLHIGVKAPKPGNWSGFFASTQSSTTPFPTVFHALITAPSRTISANDFDAGIYVQTAQPLINYVFCGEATSTTLTYWSVILANGNPNQATKYTTLYVDSASNQPLTRECTIITNGQNYLKVYIDHNLVYQSTTLKQNMTTPFIFFLESQTSNAAQVLFGAFSNYYSTASENVVVNSLPSAATTVQIVDSSGTVLATASVSSGAATLPVGQFSFPLKGKIIVYGAGNKVLASTPGVVSIYGGDVYSVH